MKVILVARKALAAYLMSSAVRRSVMQYRRGVEIERPVDFLHERFGALVLDPDDNAVGPFEIIDGRPFPQKFRVGHDREIGVGPGFTDDSFNLVAGADGNGGFCHDHRKPIEASGDRAGRLVDK